MQPPNFSATRQSTFILDPSRSSTGLNGETVPSPPPRVVSDSNGPEPISSISNILNNKIDVLNFFQKVSKILKNAAPKSQKEEQLHGLIDEYIVSNRIDINARDPQSQQTLLIAIAEKHPKVALYLITLDKGIDCSATDNLGYNALHQSVENDNLISSEENEQTILLIEKLKEKGVDINIPTYNKYTALHLALQTISLSIIKNKCDLLKAHQRLEALFPEINFYQKGSIGNPIDILSQTIVECDNTSHKYNLESIGDWLKSKEITNSRKLTLEDVREKLRRGDKNFEGANLEGLDLRNFFFGEGFSFKSANMKGVIFGEHTKIDNSDFSGTQLQGAIMEKMYLRNSNFTDAKLRDVKLSGSNLSKSNLTNTEIQNSELVRTNLEKVYHKGAPPNLAHANARESIWDASQLDGLTAPGIDLTKAQTGNLLASLKYANLIGATFCGANFFTVNLAGSNISKSHWKDAYLPFCMTNVNATDAQLNECYIKSVDFTEADLTNTDLSNPKECHCMKFSGAILKNTNFTGNDKLRDAIRKGVWPNTVIALNKNDFNETII